MMNYSKNEAENSNELKAEGLVIVRNDTSNHYYVNSQNIINKVDKEKIESILNNIQILNKDEIKREYKELRESGKNSHLKGGGIGFYSIAKRCDKLEFEFKSINENKFHFHLKIKL